MSEKDLANLETQFDVLLPASYREAVLDPQNADLEWEFSVDPSELEEHNRILRDEGFFGVAWRADHFSIGADGCGNYFITTAPPDGRVYLADHEALFDPDSLDSLDQYDSVAEFVRTQRELAAEVEDDVRQHNERVDGRRWWEFWKPRKKIAERPTKA